MKREQLTRRVDIVIFDRCNIVDAAGPSAVFGAANEASGATAPLYETRFVATKAGKVTTTAGPSLHADAALTPLTRPADTLICAGGKGVRCFIANAGSLETVRRVASQAERVVSVCTGAFILAEAGLLDGRRAVTHWNSCAELQERYPAINVDPSPIFIRDGNVLTSAGVTAGMDLALALVEADHGRELALAAARDMVMYMKRPGTQDQFSTHLASQMAQDEDLGRLQQWVLANLVEEIDIDTLADRAAMSPRTLHRRFKASTGMSPARFIAASRVESARRLLEESTMQIKVIASECGFGDEERMRRAFHRFVGISPDDYRTRFGSSIYQTQETHP